LTPIEPIGYCSFKIKNNYLENIKNLKTKYQIKLEENKKSQEEEIKKIQLQFNKSIKKLDDIDLKYSYPIEKKGKIISK